MKKQKFMLILATFACFICLCLLTACNDLQNNATNAQCTIDLEYELNADQESYTVVGIGACVDKDIVVNYYQNKPVTAIARKAFDSVDIRNVTIGNNVKTIGALAFCGTNLQSITIGTGLTSVEDSAFSDCEIKDVYITDIKAWCDIEFDSVEANPMYNSQKLFINNQRVTELVVPDTVTEIKRCAFSGCKISRLVIPDSVTSIGVAAFSGCVRLTTMTLSKNLTSIGESAFWGCINLWSVTIPDGVTTIEKYTFYMCDNLKSLNLGKSITTIKENAFGGCDEIKRVVLPDGLTEIGVSAFGACWELETVIIPVGIQKIAESVFENCVRLDKIYYLGTPEQWNSVNIEEEYTEFDVNVYYYSATEPTDDGNYWHYDTDGKTPVVWTKQD